MPRQTVSLRRKGRPRSTEAKNVIQSIIRKANKPLDYTIVHTKINEKNVLK